MPGQIPVKIKDFDPFAVKRTPLATPIEPANECCEFKEEDIRQSIVSRFEQQVEKYPHKIALTFGAVSITYDTLNRLANRVARQILRPANAEESSETNSPAALLFDYGIEMMVGIFGALKAGKAYVALDCTYPAPRVRYMLQDSQAGLILTDNDNVKLAAGLNRDLPQPLPIVNIEDAGAEDSQQNQDPRIRIHPDHIAYIMYTSGSTGIPKGVVQTHGNVLHFIRVYANRLHINANDRMTMFSSYSYDASVMDIFGALLNGAALFPFNIKTEGSLGALPGWLKREKITLYHSVPTLFRYFTDSLKTGSSFPGLRMVVLGGEPVYRADVERYKRCFNHDCLFLNLFGSTESSISLLYFMDKQTEASKETVPLGVPVQETGVLVVDDTNKEVPVFGIGEIVFQSPYLALGYLNRPEETTCVFTSEGMKGREEKGNEENVYGHDRYYRTGDLGRRLPDGSIEYVSRRDFQVKVRGYRIELREIETTLDQVEGIKKSVVLCRQAENNENVLVAFYIKDEDIDLKDIIRQLKNLLPDHMIPARFVAVKEFPLTTTGKLDRNVLLAMENQGKEQHYTGPTDEVEEKLVEIWGGILKLEKEKISIDANFFDLGGQSFKAIILLANIHKIFDVKVSLSEVFNIATVTELARYIRKAVKDKFTAIVPAGNKDFYALSSAQRRLYILHQLAPESTAYNATALVQLEGVIDVDRLEQALSALVRRHESFRTSFRINEAEVEAVQKIHPFVDFSLEYDEADQEEIPALIRAFIRPFDLSRPPLLRVKLVRLSYEKAVLMTDMHHIITDGTSMGIFSQELMKLYEGIDLEPLDLQYKDFSEWWHSRRRKESLEKQEMYWKKEFAAGVPVLELPLDFPRPRLQSFAGNLLRFELSKSETALLKDLASSQEVTLFMVILAIYTVLLSKLSGQEDVVIGTPIAGRGHAGLEHIIGIFVNTLVLRNFPHREKNFDYFLQQLKLRTLDAFANQDYQFEDLVEKVVFRRDTSRNPLFDTMFVFQNLDRPEIEIPDLSMKPLEYGDRMSKFDLTLIGMESEDTLCFSVEYCTRLYKKETIQRFIDYFINLVTAIPRNPAVKLYQLEMIPAREKKLLLEDINQTGSDFPKDLTIHALFERQAEKSPHHTALAAEVLGGAAGHHTGRAGKQQEHLTYQELNRKSQRLACLLQEKGVRPGVIAAVHMERCAGMIIAILGILKAGGAYLPVDPVYPQERTQYMLADSKAKVLVTSAKREVEIDHMINLETVLASANENTSSTFSSNCRVCSTDLAYVIYTSGSTGRPKGVMVEHGSLVNYIWWAAGYYLEGEAINFPLYSSIAFDLTVTSVFTPLITGNAIIIYSRHDYEQENYSVLHNIIGENRVGIVKLTPSHLKLLKNEDYREELKGRPGRIKGFIVGGEAFDTQLARDIFDYFGGGIEMYNEYGPTETVVGCMIHPFRYENDNRQTIGIGRPIHNMRVYILDPYLKLVPPGTAGELFIAGAGLARGYLNRPDETAEKFLENTYIPNEMMYRSGDLARWLPGPGEIEFLGRIDSQVKIRGYRVELEEIRNRLSLHEQVSESVVIALEKQVDGLEDTYLCAYFVPVVPVVPADAGKIPDNMSLKEFLSQGLPEYMIPDYFMPVQEIPLTPNGKVDREALPDPAGGRSGGTYISPGNETEERLAEIWSQILGRGKNTISRDANFFHLGGHSLTATILVSKIHKAFNVIIPLAELFNRPTLREQAEDIRHLKEDRFYSIDNVEKKEYYPLSSAQKRLYILQQMESAGVLYNILQAVVLEGKPDREKMKGIFKELIHRHESLRTSFQVIKGEPVQRIRDEVNIEIEYVEMAASHENYQSAISIQKEKELHHSFIRAFDLSTAPLMRVGLIKSGEEKHVLVVDMHHIISDGISVRILLNEFKALNSGKKLKGLNIQYKDFSVWQNRKFASGAGELKKQEQYWLQAFSGTIPVLHLPIDYERPDLQSFAGKKVTFEIGADETAAIKKYLENENITLFILLLAVYYVLLAKISGQEDIILGTAVAGRKHADLEHIIGSFVNTLALRNYPCGHKSFKEFLAEVKKSTLEAFNNQDYPFEALVDQLVVDRNPGRNPLYDVIFALENTRSFTGTSVEPDPDSAIQGWEIMPDTYEKGKSKVDMTFIAEEWPDKIRFDVVYCTSLFKEQTIRKITEYYKTLLLEILEDSRRILSRIEVRKEEEIRQIAGKLKDQQEKLQIKDREVALDQAGKLKAEFDF